jgi:2-oxoglutarate ferredoxin oxidoreductase subunit beta
MDCSFVARGYVGDIDHLKELMKEAINHQGFSLVDIFQPCVTFNKVNTYDWYKKRCYRVESTYDPSDRVEAFRRAMEFGERIPLGVLYRNQRPVFEEKVPVLREKPLVRQEPLFPRVDGMLEEFY